MRLFVGVVVTLYIVGAFTSAYRATRANLNEADRWGDALLAIVSTLLAAWGIALLAGG